MSVSSKVSVSDKNSESGESKSSAGGKKKNFFPFWGSKDIEPIDEEGSQEATSSEEETDDEEIARENARPQSTRTKIVVNLQEEHPDKPQDLDKRGKKKINSRRHLDEIVYHLDDYDRVRM